MLLVDFHRYLAHVKMPEAALHEAQWSGKRSGYPLLKISEISDLELTIRLSCFIMSKPWPTSTPP
jgi:hypothetical protein